jgi:hypothetical protein
VKKCGRAGHATDGNIIQRMRFACRITKATDTHSEYVILFAFPRQQWLHERATVLRYTYITCLVFYPMAVSVILRGKEMSVERNTSDMLPLLFLLGFIFVTVFKESTENASI